MSDRAIEANDSKSTKSDESSSIGYFGTKEDLQILSRVSETKSNTELAPLTLKDRAAKDVQENNHAYKRDPELSKLFENVSKNLTGTANVSQLLKESGAEVTSTALAKELKANMDRLAEGDAWGKQEFKGEDGKEALFKLLGSQDQGAVVLARRLAKPDESGIRWKSDGNKKYKSHFIIDGPDQSVYHTINRPDEGATTGKWSAEGMQKAIGHYDEFIVYSPKQASAKPARTEFR